MKAYRCELCGATYQHDAAYQHWRDVHALPDATREVGEG